MASNVPTCNQCGKDISWNKTVREEWGIKGPLEPGDKRPHKYKAEDKQAFQAQNSTNSPPQQSSNNNNTATALLDQSTHIQKIEEYNLTQVESLSRITDLLHNQQSKIDLLDLVTTYLRYTNSHIASIDKTLTEILNVLSDKQAQQRQSEEEIIGGIQEQ